MPIETLATQHNSRFHLNIILHTCIKPQTFVFGCDAKPWIKNSTIRKTMFMSLCVRYDYDRLFYINSALQEIPRFYRYLFLGNLENWWCESSSADITVTAWSQDPSQQKQITNHNLQSQLERTSLSSLASLELLEWKVSLLTSIVRCNFALWLSSSNSDRLFLCNPYPSDYHILPYHGVLQPCPPPACSRHNVPRHHFVH